jgi:hypothetical protein
MGNMKKILIFPGTFQTIKNYGDYDGLDIWLKSSFIKDIPPADYYIGHSGGINFILSHYDSIQKGKFIFINPLIKKRSIIILLWNWLKFFFVESIKIRKVVPISNWLYCLKMVSRLLKIDVFGIIQKIPKENLVIIRGKNDNYFCDKESAEIIKSNNIKLIEIEAGHDWNEKIAQAVKTCIIPSN